MTYEEIDERHRDSALDDDGDESSEGDEATSLETGWDDPSELNDEDDDPDEES